MARDRGPITPLSDSALAELIENVTSLGGFMSTEPCKHCREATLMGVPNRYEGPYSSYAALRRKKTPEYAAVCIVCDEVWKWPSLN